MLPIGVIGVGTDWNAVWRPALAQLSRLSVTSFYDPVAKVGEQVAEAFGWTLAPNARRLLETPKLRGIVILDAGWLGNWAIHQADLRRIPVFVSPADSSLECLAAALGAATGETLIQPELRRRYTPATMRVRELTATRLGPVKSLRVELSSMDRLTTSDWAEAVDWCRYVLQSSVTRASYALEEDTLQVVFRKRFEEAPVEAAIVQRPADEGIAATASFTAELICREGVAIITGSRRVRWKAGDDEADEELSDDRSSAVVQLDLFARRLAGGLVPVSSLDEVASAVQWARGAMESLS